jgi:hypothetical protein
LFSPTVAPAAPTSEAVALDLEGFPSAQSDRAKASGRSPDHKRTWFKSGLFLVTQTTGMLPPGKGGFGAEMKKTESVSNRFRVQLKGAETA